MSIRIVIAAAALSLTAGAAIAHDPTNLRPHTSHASNTPEYITPSTYTAGPSGHMYIPHYEDPGVVVISRKRIGTRGVGRHAGYPATNVYGDATAGAHNAPRTQIYNN